MKGEIWTKKEVLEVLKVCEIVNGEPRLKKGWFEEMSAQFGQSSCQIKPEHQKRATIYHK